MSYSLNIPTSSAVIRPNVSLGELTSYRIGGMAQWYASVKTLSELEEVFQWYSRESLPLTFLGAGSNLLISDQGLPGLVLSTRYLRYYTIDKAQGRITAAAGEPIARIAWIAARLGWSGLEWAVGIPGTIGGSVVMNAGAHGKSVADVLSCANVASYSGNLSTLTSGDFQFSYRNSLLQKQPRLLVEATFQLEPGHDKELIKSRTSQNLHKRRDSQPYDRPSCGSVFRNPYPQAAGQLIEQLGLKGYQIGQAQVSLRHANFIVNQGQAKAFDVFRLIHHVRQQVEKKWSILLEPEVKMLGEFPSI